jgi:hypothetical protein
LLDLTFDDIEISLAFFERLSFFTFYPDYIYEFLIRLTGGFGLALVFSHIGICLAAVRILKTLVQCGHYYVVVFRLIFYVMQGELTYFPVSNFLLSFCIIL